MLTTASRVDVLLAGSPRLDVDKGQRRASVPLYGPFTYAFGVVPELEM